MNQLTLTMTEPKSEPRIEPKPKPKPEPTHREVVAAFNSLDGAQIRYDETLGEYVTTDGDRYPSGDVLDVVKHLLERRAA